MDLKRFAVKCMFQLTYYEPGGAMLPRSSWAERILFIKAKDVEESYQIAEEISYEYECEYTNPEGLYVCCRLYELSDSCELSWDKLKTGGELYTNYFDATVEEVEEMLHKQYGDKAAPPDAVN
ncbi:MAG: DUF4288 domain-containing protein [Clostridiales bacterium]|nr:DUF4288 domain-containing protein [Candidatus Coliplasma caballi]